jgi:hypothetical protein
MDMDQAAVFLGGSILTMLGFITVVIGIVAINNIIARFWKPVRIFTPDSWKGFMPPSGFVNQEELDRVAPRLDALDKKEAK